MKIQQENYMRVIVDPKDKARFLARINRRGYMLPYADAKGRNTIKALDAQNILWDLWNDKKIKRLAVALKVQSVGTTLIPSIYVKKNSKLRKDELIDLALKELKAELDVRWIPD